MWDVIRGLVREGTTLLLTTQYLEEADELADTIAVVDHGRIIARGTADELKAQVGGERIEVDRPPPGRHRSVRPRSSSALRQRGGRARRAHAQADACHADGRGAGARPGRRATSTTRAIAIDDIGAPPPDARRRVPVPDRSRRRADGGRRQPARAPRRREGGMTAVARTLAARWAAASASRQATDRRPASSAGATSSGSRASRSSRSSRSSSRSCSCCCSRSCSAARSRSRAGGRTPTAST